MHRQVQLIDANRLHFGIEVTMAEDVEGRKIDATGCATWFARPMKPTQPRDEAMRQHIQHQRECTSDLQFDGFHFALSPRVCQQTARSGRASLSEAGDSTDTHCSTAQKLASKYVT